MNISELIESRGPRVGKTLFIAVDGHGGSGKSSLADQLADLLNAEIIHTDDFASWDNPTEWWPLLIAKVFKPIEKGATTLRYSRTKWWKSHHPKPVVDQPVTSIMILEGVGSFRKEFRNYISIGIFVDTPVSICKKRVIERDSKVGEPMETIQRLWKDWLNAENVYFEAHAPKANADLFVNGTVPFAQQIAELQPR